MDYSDVYLDYSSKFSGKPNSTLTTHGNIAKEIGKIKVVKKLDYQSMSHNIHQNSSPCQLWQKVDIKLL